MRRREELVPYLLDRVNYITRGVDFRFLFTPSWSHRTMDCARVSLEESIRDVDLPPQDLCTYLYLTEYHRRSSVASLELFRESVEVRLPLLDPTFVDLLARAPADWRYSDRIPPRLIARHRVGHAARSQLEYRCAGRRRPAR